MEKCRRGYKRVGAMCVQKKRNFQSNGVLEHNRIVRNVIIGMTFILAFLWVINPPARSAVGINIVFLGIAFLVYRASEYQDDLIGILKNNALASVGYGIIFTFGFFLITLIIPGMSIGFPSLPASISDQLKFFLVVIVAPIVETIFFQGALYAYISNFDSSMNKKKKWRAIIIQALGFSIFHLGAYVSGFYMYPGFTEGMTAVTANISGFIVAFLFALIAGWFMTRDGIKNLIFVAVFHLGLNLIAYSLSVAVLLSSAPLIGSFPAMALSLVLIGLPSYKISKKITYLQEVGRTYKYKIRNIKIKHGKKM